MESHIISTLFLRLLIMNALNTSRLLSSVPFFFILLSSSHLSLHIYIKWTCLLSPPATPAAAPPPPQKKKCLVSSNFLTRPASHEDKKSK